MSAMRIRLAALRPLNHPRSHSPFKLLVLPLVMKVDLSIDDELARQLERLVDGKSFSSIADIAQLYLDESLRKSTIRQAVVLAGGKGSRLRPITHEMPKPMVPFRGKPLLAHVIEMLRKNGIFDITIAAGYKAAAILNHFGDGSRFGVSLRYVVEDEPLGTAGALKLTKQHLTGPFVVTNADELKDFDLQPLFALHASTKAIGTIALTKVDDPSAYGIAHLEDTRILRFVEKPSDAFSNLANAGLYVVSPKIFDFIPDGFSMTETDVFPVLARSNALHGLHLEGQWFDTGTLDRYEQALKEWKGFTFR